MLAPVKFIFHWQAPRLGRGTVYLETQPESSHNSSWQIMYPGLFSGNANYLRSTHNIMFINESPISNSTGAPFVNVKSATLLRYNDVLWGQ